MSLAIHSLVIDLVGTAAAAITTLCWVPQALKVIRTRETRAISLAMHSMLTVGLVLWLAYGVMLVSWPLIIANTITLVLVLTILRMKLRYG